MNSYPHNEEVAELGRRVKQLRVKFSLDQSQLGEMTGVSGSAISLLESGKTKDPSVSLVVKLSQALKVGLDELVFGNAPTYTLSNTQTNSGNVQENVGGYGGITQTVGGDVRSTEELAKCREEVARLSGQVEILREMMMKR